MTRIAHIDLPGGRRLDYRIRRSARAKSVLLKMTAWDGLTVTAPKGLSESQVVELVTGHRDWIAARLDRFDQARHLLGEPESGRPEAFDLPALGESWRVEYRPTRGGTVGARTGRPGRILVRGAVSDNERCKAALRRWLARRAKEALAPWLESLAAGNGLKFSRISIKNQRTRWGSRSSSGLISLNAKLLFLPPELVRYVLMHELCHTLERNHTSRFWTRLRRFEPQADILHDRMRDAWKMIPIWAHPVRVTG
ncbi:MAG: M48 family metallopeptidase [Proteobacteria bacterium]|nr:M48 family metallopeptidase [Pseudomonadota bacterium]